MIQETTETRIHEIINLGFGVYGCKVCTDWHTKDLTEVAEHAVSNQFEVRSRKDV